MITGLPTPFLRPSSGKGLMESVPHFTKKETWVKTISLTLTRDSGIIFWKILAGLEAVFTRDQNSPNAAALSEASALEGSFPSRP